jgi:hypothetical protein
LAHILTLAAANAGSATLIVLIASTVGGAILRVAVARYTGPDPRPARVWVAELVVVAILGFGFGVLFALGRDPAWVGPALGAGVTTYAAAGGAFGYLGGRDIDPPNPWRWGLLHFVASMGVGSVSYTGSLLAIQLLVA